MGTAGRLSPTSVPARPASGGGQDVIGDHAVLVPLDHVEHRPDQRLGEQVRSQTELRQLGVRGVVVVLLQLDPGIVQVLDPDVEPDLGAGVAHQLGELDDRELLGELVEHAELARLGRMQDRELHALERVDDVQVAARLAALAVRGQRVSDHGLQAEAVQGRAEHVVVVEPRQQALVEPGLLGLDPVHDPLVEVGRAQAPDPAREVDVVRVVHLRQVVHRAGQLRERQGVRAPVVLDLEVALLDVDVRRAVLAHRAELDQVRVGGDLGHRVQDVQRVDDVVRLREHGVLPVDHRVRGARHLAVVDDRLGPELAEQALDDAPVGQVALGDADLQTRDLSERLGPGRQRGADRGERIRPGLVVGTPPQVVVDRVHLVARAGEVHRGRPPEVAVAAEDQDPHAVASLQVRSGVGSRVILATRHRSDAHYARAESSSSTRSTSSGVL